MASGFDDEDDLEESVADIDATIALPGVGAPIGGEAEEDVWDEADFDEDFDEDFDSEPDEDLERFEQELNAKDLTNDNIAALDAELEEEDF